MVGQEEAPAVDQVLEVVAMVGTMGRGVANRQRMPKAGTVLEVVPKVDAAHKLFKGDWFSMKRERDTP